MTWLEVYFFLIDFKVSLKTVLILDIIVMYLIFPESGLYGMHVSIVLLSSTFSSHMLLCIFFRFSHIYVCSLIIVFLIQENLFDNRLLADLFLTVFFV